MKIAIQGHPTRGKEVIQILESLGGKNRAWLQGTAVSAYYYINYNENNIILCHDITYVNKYCKKHTLEEFEKEFPFKIGDKVKYITSTCIVKEYCYVNNKPVYEVESMEFGIVATIPVEMLEPYKEMKEERNITLTLEKAKEWYKKGGELREIALQAFTEKELNPLPRSWEEFCINNPIKFEETYIGTCSKFISRSETTRNPVYDRYVCPSNKSAKAHLALIQLEQLRDCWRQGWKPDWLDGNTKKYAIKVWRDKSLIEITHVTHAFLSFPTYALALEFQECFKDLIEKAGDLI